MRLKEEGKRGQGAVIEMITHSSEHLRQSWQQTSLWAKLPDWNEVIATTRTVGQDLTLANLVGQSLPRDGLRFAKEITSLFYANTATLCSQQDSQAFI